MIILLDWTSNSQKASIKSRPALNPQLLIHIDLFSKYLIDELIPENICLF